VEEAPLEPIRHRFKKLLARRLSLRAHMFLLLLGVFVLSFLVSFGLFHAGLRSMPVRYGLVTLLAYGGFLLLMRLWLYYFVESAGESAEVTARAVQGGARRLTKNAGDVVDEAVDAGGSTGSSGGLSLDVDGEGAIIVIVIGIVLLAIFSCGVYLIWQAPIIMSEAAFQAVLAAGLIRAAKRMDAEHWTASLFKSTWWLVLVVLLLAVAGGWVIQHFCPEASTIASAVRLCV
jgi:hypothetical protein